MSTNDEESIIEKALAKRTSSDVGVVHKNTQYDDYRNHHTDNSGFVPNAPPHFLLEDQSGIDLGQMFRSIWHYRGMFATLALIFATILVIGNHKIFPDKYEASASVRVKAIGIDDDDRVARSFSIVPSEVLSNRVLEKVITDLEMTKRDKVPFIESALHKAGIEVSVDPTDPSGIIRWLKNGVQINQERIGSRTAVFTVSLIDKDPETATNVVNAIVNTYIDLRHVFEADDSKEAVLFLTDKLAVAQSNFDTASESLTKFQMENSDFLIPTVTIEQNINRLQLEYVDAKARAEQLNELTPRLRRLLKGEPRYISSSTVVGASSSLTDQLAQLEGRLASAISSYSSTHPVIKHLKSKIASMETQIKNSPKRRTVSGRTSNPEYLRLRQEIETNEAERIVLERRLPSIKENIIRLTNHLSHAKSAQSSLMTYQSEWDKTYNDLRLINEQYIEYETKAQAQSSETGKDLNVLDYANVPTLPISAARTKLMMLGIISSVIVAFSIVTLISMIRKWKIPENEKQISTTRYVFASLLGTIWFASLIGYIIVSPYIL